MYRTGAGIATFVSTGVATYLAQQQGTSTAACAQVHPPTADDSIPPCEMIQQYFQIVSNTTLLTRMVQEPSGADAVDAEIVTLPRCDVLRTKPLLYHL